MILKTIGLAAMAALLMGASCKTTGQPPIVVPKNKVWKIPEEYLACSKVFYPDADTLTDKQVARLIVALEKNLNVCHMNMAAIRKLQAHAITTIEKGK